MNHSPGTAVPPGYLEAVEPGSALGWATYAEGAPANVYAMLGHEMLGAAIADLIRTDAEASLAVHNVRGGGFLIVFNRELSPQEQARVSVTVLGGAAPLLRLPGAAPEPEPEEELPLAFPVFIVGSPRSGTSILAHALLSAGYAGYNEGNFLSLLHRLDADVDTHFKVFGSGNTEVLTAHINQQALKADLFAVLRAHVEVHIAGEPWLDKTGNPEMIAAIPILRQLWPESVFIFAKRRAIENIASRLRKFPNHDFRYHCADWARNMASWREIRAAQPGLRFLEVDQQDIAAAPAAVARAIAGLLRLPPARERMIADIFARDRPQETEAGTAARVLSLEATGWGEDMQAVFRQHCGPEMAAYGYTEDESYRHTGTAGALPRGSA
jgi:hypothetical protein